MVQLVVGLSLQFRCGRRACRPDVLVQFSMENPRRGRQSVKKFMSEFRSAFPDLGFERIGALIADRDIVVVRWEGGGTHTGPAFDDFHIGGPLPVTSGRKIALCGHSAIRLADGMIVEEAVWSTERKAKLRCLTGSLMV
jgi:predicted ester cyclase